MPTIRPAARCDTAEGHYHDTIGLALGCWAQAGGRERACGCERARGGQWSAGARGKARRGAGHGAGVTARKGEQH